MIKCTLLFLKYCSSRIHNFSPMGESSLESQIFIIRQLSFRNKAML